MPSRGRTACASSGDSREGAWRSCADERDPGCGGGGHLRGGGVGFRAAFSPEILFWAHRDYPLLVPGAVAQAFLLARSESPWVPAAVSYAFAAAIVVLLGAAARELRGAGWGALTALALLSTP